MSEPNYINPVLFFDGVCKFCNSTVNFIIKHDKKQLFRFATLQSDIGKQTIEIINNKKLNTDSVILFYENNYFINSAAIFYTFKVLGGWWHLLYIGIYLPSFTTDFFYKLFAKYRYKLFGKLLVCSVPNPAILHRFL